MGEVSSNCRTEVADKSAEETVKGSSVFGAGVLLKVGAGDLRFEVQFHDWSLLRG